MTREDDEAVLHILARHRAGDMPRAIAADTGRTSKQISHLIERIRTADSRYDTEASEWWQRNHPARNKGRPK